ncbi:MULTISPECIES: hypothetical protein [unclassified Methanoculleus]|jgi:hypothetical protein|uniref:hypothetical protein n=1 Tax=unclassified Methanoculleus TaxID=2619537 RepID=UPI00319E1DAD
MTRSSLLRYDETLFRDREVFEFTYRPPGHLRHRDAQVRELADSVAHSGYFDDYEALDVDPRFPGSTSPQRPRAGRRRER